MNFEKGPSFDPYLLNKKTCWSKRLSGFEGFVYIYSLWINMNN
ncbi:hypothetical protein SAMN03080601_01156 [Alkalitalea saponilacus]|uniref:Uncharacterized protein n=1 Tax=Alkalitalea saponilacus TaxID=889453 RepID=A0A1T5DXE5_9BACT|nr:hypothetical protein SAMN03080601_01156 [Alkalitalea saponilacus]